MNILATAIAFAANKHEQQIDKGGKAYILHPLRMMLRLRTDDEELMCIAVLHDVVEDCGVSYAQLMDLGMSTRVIEGLQKLTRNPGETYEEFIDRICFSRDAMLVKREDLRDNSDITRLKGVSDKDNARMVRYNKAYVKISNELDKFGCR